MNIQNQTFFSLQNKRRQVLLVIPYIHNVRCYSLIWPIHFFLTAPMRYLF
jgi:hypothetical protein